MLKNAVQLLITALLVLLSLVADLLGIFDISLHDVPVIVIQASVGTLVVFLFLRFIRQTAKDLQLPALFGPDFYREIQRKQPHTLPPDTQKALQHMARAALVLLLLDKTKSGIWGWTYLYRTVKSNEIMPVVGGGLTSVPQSLLTFMSLVETDNIGFIDYASHGITQTLERFLKENGQYFKGTRVGAGGLVPVFEPHRHTAGGILGRMLLGIHTEKDIAAVRFFLRQSEEYRAWDAAIIIRMLSHVVYDNKFPFILRVRAQRYRLQLLTRLIALAGNNPDAEIWSYDYAYGIGATNQWDAVWAIYPLLSDNLVPLKQRQQLKRVLFRLISSHANVADCESMLPRGFESGHLNGVGEYTYSTLLAPLVLRILDTFMPEPPSNLVSFEAMLERVLKNNQKVILNPALDLEGDFLKIEGFFAWAALGMLAAGFGICLDRVVTTEIINAVEEIRQIDTPNTTFTTIRDQICQILAQHDLFADRYLSTVATAATNVLKYRDAVTPKL